MSIDTLAFSSEANNRDSLTRYPPSPLVYLIRQNPPNYLTTYTSLTNMDDSTTKALPPALNLSMVASSNAKVFMGIAHLPYRVFEITLVIPFNFRQVLLVEFFAIVIEEGSYLAKNIIYVIRF